MERDDESGFYYIGARYYCPWLARWLAPDPINNEWYNLTHGNPTRNLERHFLVFTASGYEYCYANPVRFIDPTGEQHIPAELSAPKESDMKFAPTYAQDNLAPQKAPLNAGGDYIPTTQLEKDLAVSYWAHSGQKLNIPAPTISHASSSQLHKMTPQERKLHEQVRAQKLELAGYTPDGEPTGATKLAQNKHWQGLANNIVLPTLEAASVVDGVVVLRKVLLKSAEKTVEYNIALGVRENLDAFAVSRNAATHKSWDYKTMYEFESVFTKEVSKADNIYFNLTLKNDKMLNVHKALKTKATPFNKVTNWELQQIFNDKSLIDKTKFYHNNNLINIQH